MASENRVQWVYASKDRGELAARYDEWAKDYDADLANDFEWRGAELAWATFAKYVSSDARVMDVGVGTGLAGWELTKLGFSNMDGFDLSPGMIEEAKAKAKAKGWYRSLKVGVLGEPLGDYADDTYDAALATGVFTEGHAPASGFDEVVRIVKPGSYFVITLRPDIYETNGFKAKEAELAGKMTLVKATDPVAMLPKGEPDIRHQVRVYEIL